MKRFVAENGAVGPDHRRALPGGVVMNGLDMCPQVAANLLHSLRVTMLFCLYPLGRDVLMRDSHGSVHKLNTPDADSRADYRPFQCRIFLRMRHQWLPSG